MEPIQCGECGEEIPYLSETCPSCGKAIAILTSDHKSELGKTIVRSGMEIAAGAIPLVGGIFSAAASAWEGHDQENANAFFKHWLRMLFDELREKEQTIVEIMARVDMHDAKIEERMKSSEYQSLIKKAFREWPGAESEDKRKLIRNILSNAAASTLVSDDVIKLFLDWLKNYSELHFKVIGVIYNKNGITRGEVWRQLGKQPVREDSAEAGAAAAAFKSQILAEALTPFLRKVQQPDGGFLTQWQIRGGIEDPLDSALKATAKPWEGDTRGRLIPPIEWTAEDAERLVSLMDRWWDDEGHQLAQAPSMFFESFSRHRYQLVAKTLAYTVLFSLPAKHRALNKSLSLLRKIEAAGIPVECALPLVLAVEPSSTENVASALRSALVSTERDRTAGAIEGIYLWATRSARGDLPGTPNDLVREIGTTVRMRRPLALDMALAFSSRLLAQSSVAVRDLIVDDIRIGLQYLAEELRYRSPAEYSGPVPYEDVPWYRILCGQLANGLVRYLGPDDPTVQLWARQVAEEPLTYVRRAIEGSLG